MNGNGAALRKDISDKHVRVVTICSEEHLDVWKLTSSLLPKMLLADEYSVYVPDDQVDLFRKNTNQRISVLGQNALDRNFKSKLQQKLANAGNDSRLGWYLQQFYKLEIVFQPQSENHITIIWDADCVPTKVIRFEDTQGRLLYMRTAIEQHLPYFELIHQTLGLTKIVDISFVIPSFPIYGFMAQELRKRLEGLHSGVDWSDQLIERIDFSLRSGFSETELLGTWVSNMYPNQFAIYSGNWERRGQKRFGYARNLSENKLIRLGAKYNLDIISFENWDTRGFRLVVKRIIEVFNMRSQTK